MINDSYMLILFGIPIIWFVSILSYKIINLFCLWLKLQLENIKEIKIWD